MRPRLQLLAMLCTAVLAAATAGADDTELLIDPGKLANYSVASESHSAALQNYDSAQRYAGNCDQDTVYWSDVDAVPDCSTSRNIIAKRDFHCRSAAEQLVTTGYARQLLAQYRNGGSDGYSVGPYRWQFLASGHANSPVECREDLGVHGDGRTHFRWPAAGTNVSDPYTDKSQEALAWGSTPRNRRYSIYDGNYLNWLHGQSDDVLVANSPPAIRPDPGSCAIDSDLSFTKPIVVTNPLNQTQHLNEVYVSTISVRAATRWPGKLQKYRVNANGIDGSRGLWNAPFGENSHQAPLQSARRLFSNLVSNALTADGNAIVAGNAALDAASFGLTGAAGEPSLDELLDWMRGTDAQGETQAMGDALHAQGAAVVYNDGSESETVIFAATNDGFLHAISGDDGEELWAFIPEQLLAKQARLYRDLDTPHKNYGLDGNIVPVIKDADRDGQIEAEDGDFVYVLFGMRRGGQAYFALDVTDRRAPVLLWIFDSKESGESWSTPSVARMHIAGAVQNADRAVVILGGGYDTVHDSTTHPADADGSGAGIHILDLVSGERLWRAGMDAGANLLLNAVGREMDRAIPNQVRVIDLNADGLADRMYASDLGGQVWRFDVNNGQNANRLINGGIIAQLGADGVRTKPTPAQTRRFYNSPDVSLVTDVQQQQRYVAISLGSGYRAHPRDVSASDRFFSIRDPDVFRPLSQQEYDKYSPITPEQLVEVSGAAPAVIDTAARGWMITLPANEKVLADSLTFDDQVFFVAFSPDGGSATDCAGSLGKNIVYRLKIVNGATIGMSTEIQHTGIAPSPMAMFPGPDLNCSGDECSIRPLLCVGVDCFRPDQDAVPVRTLWTQDGID